MFHRYAQGIPLANLSQMVNCIGIICSGHKGTFLTPSGLVFKIYTEHAGKMLLPSHVDCPTIPHETGLPVLDLSATRTDNRLALFVVNRHYDAQVNTTVLLKGVRHGSVDNYLEISHPNPIHYNTYTEPNEIQISKINKDIEITHEGSGAVFDIRLPAHSLTCIEISIRY